VSKRPQLTEEAIRELRAVFAARQALPTNVQLAKKYGVAVTAIAAAMRPDKYKWVQQ
jgi:hypothetical protein